MPYKTRQRWFRTPNDAFMATHYSDRTKILPELRITSWTPTVVPSIRPRKGKRRSLTRP